MRASAPGVLKLFSRSPLGQGPVSGESLWSSVQQLPHLVIFGLFAHALRVGLVSVSAAMDLHEVSVELPLQGLLVFRACGAMARGLGVKKDPGTGRAFARHRNISEPFRNPQ